MHILDYMNKNSAIKPLFIVLLCACLSCACIIFVPAPLLASATDTLSPPKVLDDIGDVVGHNDDLVLAAMAVHMELNRVRSAIASKVDPLAIKRIINKEEHIYPEELEKPLAQAKVYFGQLEQVEGHVFTVPVSVVKEGVPHDYMAVFSTALRRDGTFPVVCCTGDQLLRVRSRMAARDRTSPETAQDIARKINEAWFAARIAPAMPFTTEARACYEKIVAAAGTITDYAMPFDATTWYRICCAKLFGYEGSAFVISFFNHVRSADGVSQPLKRAILNNHSFAELYFFARMLDQETMAAVTGQRKGVIDIYGKDIFTGDETQEIDPWTDDERIMAKAYLGIVVPAFIEAHSSDDKFPLAVRVLDLIIAEFMSQDVAHDAGIERFTLNRLIDKRNEIVQDSRLRALVAAIADYSVSIDLVSDGAVRLDAIQEVVREVASRQGAYIQRALEFVLKTKAASYPQPDDLGKDAFGSVHLAPELDRFLRGEAVAMSRQLSGEETLKSTANDREGLFQRYYGLDRPTGFILTEEFVRMVEDAGKGRVLALSAARAARDARDADKNAAAAQTVSPILETLPEAYKVRGFDIDDLEDELRDALGDRLAAGERLRIDDSAVMIFSEKVTFENGLGVLLPKLARSGIRCAVVAANEQEENLIRELNAGAEDNQKILFAPSLADIRARMPAARYYYFMVAGDPEAPFRVVRCDITDIVKRIIDALGKMCKITDRVQLDTLHEAARRFAESA